MGNPWFLFGLLAAAVPVAIHLLSKRRAKRIEFPSLRFLRKTAERTSSRRRFEEILLLLLRSGALSLCAVALTSPRIGGLPIAGSGAVDAVLIVDNTLSASRENSGREIFEDLQSAAAQSLKDLPPGSKWAVWKLCAQNESDRQIKAHSEADIRSVTEKLFATGAAADLPGQIELALANFKNLTGGKELHVFTDGQASEWEEIEERLAGAIPSDNTTFFIYYPKPEAAQNLLLENVRVTSRAPLPGEDARILATVGSHSASAVNTAATLYVDGAMAARKAVSVPSGGSTQVSFEARYPASGWLRGMVALDADGCARDNRRWFASKVKERVEVLLVEGEGSSRGPAFYVEAALAPLGGGAIRPRKVTPLQFGKEDLGGVDAVFLFSLPEKIGAEKLSAFVRSGGTLVVAPFTGKCGEWNLLLGKGGAGLLPAELGGEISVGDKGLTLRPGEDDHPLLQPVRSVMRESLRRVRVRKYFKLSYDDKGPARLAVELENGEPFWLSIRVERGRVILWAAAPVRENTNLQARPVFVPLVHSHAYLGLGDGGDDSVGAGHVLKIPGTPGDKLNLILPSDETKELTAPVGNRREIEFADTWIEGLYRVTDRHDKMTALFAVNPASTDSDLASVESGFIENALKRFGKVRVIHSKQELKSAQQEERSGLDLLPILLALALILLLIEAFYGASRAKHGVAGK